MEPSRFTIRVYGLLIHEDRVLVSDELIMGRRVTKFPGGGLEYGEGSKDCLLREIREEIAVEALDMQHYYTTDFFQQSAFHERPMQVLSIYYTFRVHDPYSIPVVLVPFDGFRGTGEQEVFRWLDLRTATSEDMSLPIDRVVFSMLKD